MGRSLTGAQVAIAAYFAGEDPLITLKGPKIKNIARNLCGDTEAVTIDIWAGRVALPDHPELEKAMGRAGVYDGLAEAYRIASSRVGVSPSTIQATTWIVARNGRSS